MIEMVEQETDYFNDIFTGKQISYKKKAGEYSESKPVYVLYAGNDKIASVSLDESKKNMHKFTEWKISSIDFNVNAKDNHAVNVMVPKGSRVPLMMVRFDMMLISCRSLGLLYWIGR